MKTILVVYGLSELDGLRNTILRHLYCFERYCPEGYKVEYVNMVNCNELRRKHIDDISGIIFHYTFFAYGRITGDIYNTLNRTMALREYSCPKIAMIQDDYVGCYQVRDMIRKLKIGIIFTLAEKKLWWLYWQDLCLTRDIRQVLAGYIDDEDIEIARSYARVERDIDIGYRARSGHPSLGSFGLLKGRLGAKFNDYLAKHETGLRYDISTEHKDTKFGDEWLKFLSSCKYFLGVEGGSGIWDDKGKLNLKTNAHISNGGESFCAEVKRKYWWRFLFDGLLELRAISPRHLEACLTETCQVLVEGEYNGILKPWRHYIPVKRDFSNINDVIDQVKKDTLRQFITDNCRRDIVESGHYSYRNFVKTTFSLF